MEKINNVSTEAVQKATGKNWDEWLQIIDKTGGEKLSHKDIVTFLGENYDISPWWQQMITVGFEFARGRRVTGQTADDGFQIGVQKTVAVPQEKVWDFLLSKKGLHIWLGEIDNIILKKGAEYLTEDGTIGEIRSIIAAQKIRLIYKPKNYKKETTLQISLSCPRNTRSKTNINFHHEKLSGTQQRNEMRHHWKKVLDHIEEELLIFKE